jgi:hypothetical protein
MRILQYSSYLVAKSIVISLLPPHHITRVRMSDSTVFHSHQQQARIGTNSMRAVSIAASNDGGNTSNTVNSNAINSNNTRFQSLETMVLAFSSSSSPSTSTTIKEQLQQVQSSSASNNSISSTNDNDINTTSTRNRSTTSKNVSLNTPKLVLASPLTSSMNSAPRLISNPGDPLHKTNKKTH